VTNLVFDLLPALDRFAIRGRLFIINDPVALPEDRESIFAGVRDRISLEGTSRLAVAWKMARAWREGRRAGFRPFVAFPGVSHPSGVLGNATGFIEMMTQLERSGSPIPETVYVTAATGTTIAGFLLAEHALREAGWPAVRVVGVQVYPGAMRRWTHGLLRWTEATLGLGSRVPTERIDIVDAALHGGFARFPTAIAEVCERVVSEQGLKLDPVFGGKTWSVMEKRISRGVRPTMYWHCGFTPEWRVLGSAVARGVSS
jgi:1-aminocyclopropane-1-carboxylate deaminase/D-cysteine desulfhydrase-like pyridoxal-dependent ACC family enzyme